jgi:esterase/lipase
MEEKVFFKNAQEEKLSGIIDTVSGSKEIVIIVHGYASSKNGANNKWILNALNEAGINSFRFDLSGSGESEGKFEEQTISKAILDTKSAIEFIKSKGFEKINLLGESSGGMTCIGASLNNKEINKLILIAPSMDFVYQRMRKFGEKGIKDWEEKGYLIYEKHDGTKLRVDYSFFEDAKQNIMTNKASELEMSVLMIYGSKDETIPTENCRKFAQGLKETDKIIELEGAEHILTKNNFHIKVMQEVVKWLK